MKKDVTELVVTPEDLEHAQKMLIFWMIQLEKVSDLLSNPQNHMAIFVANFCQLQMAKTALFVAGKNWKKEQMPKEPMQVTIEMLPDAEKLVKEQAEVLGKEKIDTFFEKVAEDMAMAQGVFDEHPF